MENTDYEAQATAFMTKTGASMSVTYLRHGKHFTDDKEERDIYTVTLSRGSRSFTFEFGQSIAHSHTAYTIALLADIAELESVKPKYFQQKPRIRELQARLAEASKNIQAPSAYDVLACLTKYAPGDFAEFCASYGYETDSRNAEKTFHAVEKEWSNVRMLWTDQEIEELAEIQ